MRGDYYGWLRNDMDDVCDVFENKKNPTIAEKRRIVEKYAQSLGRHIRLNPNDIRYSGAVFRFCYSFSRLAEIANTPANFEWFPWYLPKMNEKHHLLALWKDDDLLPLSPPTSTLGDYESFYLMPEETEHRPNAKIKVEKATNANRETTQTRPAQTSQTPLPKRKPGRPRKHPLPTQTSENERPKKPLPTRVLNQPREETMVKEKSGRGTKRNRIESQEVESEDEHNKDDEDDSKPPPTSKSLRFTKKKMKAFPDKNSIDEPVEVDELEEESKPARSILNNVIDHSSITLPQKSTHQHEADYQSSFNWEILPIVKTADDINMATKVPSNPSTPRQAPSSPIRADDILQTTWTTLTTATEEVPNTEANINMEPTTPAAVIVEPQRMDHHFDLRRFATNVTILKTLPCCEHCTILNGNKFPPTCTFEGWGKPCKECRESQVNGCLNTLVPADLALPDVQPIRHLYPDYYRDRIEAINIYARHVETLNKTLASQRVAIRALHESLNTTPHVHEMRHNASDDEEEADQISHYLLSYAPHLVESYQRRLDSKISHVDTTTPIPLVRLFNAANALSGEYPHQSTSSVPASADQTNSSIVVNNQAPHSAPSLSSTTVCKTDNARPHEISDTLDTPSSPIPAASISSSSLNAYSDPPLPDKSNSGIRQEFMRAYFRHILDGGNPRIFDFLYTSTSSTST